MPSVYLSILAITGPVIIISLWNYVPKYEPLTIEQNIYWGRSEKSVQDNDEINVYSIEIPESRIDELKGSLNEKLFDKAYEDDKSQEIQYDFMKSLLKVMSDFDWKQHQHFLNTFKQYRTQIEGLQMHFIRMSTPTSKGKKLVPLLLLHGFPGSHWDFFKIIPILSNPSRHGFDFGVKEAIHFDVIVPSLPGMLFSEKPKKKGFDLVSMTRIISKLMNRLDVIDYFVYGSEGIGTDIASLLASIYPDNIKGLILSNPIIFPSFSTQIFLKYTIASFIEDFEDNRRTTSLEKFYTYPFTAFKNTKSIVPALRDSSTGLATYLMSMWHAYSASSQMTALSSLFTLDELSTIVYLYWLTDSVSSIDYLYNSYEMDTEWMRSQVSVPVSICHSAYSPWRNPHSILRYKYFNITRTTELLKGGLFAHLQDPNAVAADIFSFVELQLL